MRFLERDERRALKFELFIGAISQPLDTVINEEHYSNYHRESKSAYSTNVDQLNKDSEIYKDLDSSLRSIKLQN